MSGLLKLLKNQRNVNNTFSEISIVAVSAMLYPKDSVKSLR